MEIDNLLFPLYNFILHLPCLVVSGPWRAQRALPVVLVAFGLAGN
jgi:hypothetical protein